MLKHLLAVTAVASGILFGPALIAGALPAHAEKGADFSFTLAPKVQTFTGSYLAGRLAGSEGDAPAAAEFYRQALAADPQNLTLLDRAFVLSLVAGDDDQAIDLATRLIDKDQTHILARLALVCEALKQGRLEDASDLLAKAGQGPLAELTTTLASAWVQQGQGHTDEAFATIDGLDGPDWYGVFKTFHKGLIAEQAGREDEAGKDFEAAYKLDSGALRVMQAWTRYLLTQGRTDEAKAALDEFERKLPEHPLAAEIQAEIDAGKTPPPLVTSVDQGVAELLYGLGSALGSDSAEEYAASYIQLALYLDPSNSLARFALADFYERLKDFKAAAAAYEKVPEELALYDSANVHRALVLNANDQADEAQQVLRDVIEHDPKAMDALVALGNILRTREKFAEAVEVYTKALDLAEARGEQNWTLHYFRGIANERTGNWEQAEADLKTALDMEPGQPLVLNYLGYSWIDQGSHLEEGLSMIQQAVEARPNDGFIVDSLGWAYYKLGRYQDAVDHLERAVELMPQEAVINDHLGDAYWKIGRKLEAKFQWSHVLDLDMSEDPGLEDKVKAKLEHGLTDDEEPSSNVARELE